MLNEKEIIEAARRANEEEQQREREDGGKTGPYDYSLNSEDDIIANKHTRFRFRGWGAPKSIMEIADNPTDQDLAFANDLWLKLKAAFNKEAKHYDPETNTSRLGSIGDKAKREVMRSMWWNLLEGDRYGDYDTITRIIEALHYGEKLATGTILFGS
jgi:hypothetical protein